MTQSKVGVGPVSGRKSLFGSILLLPGYMVPEEAHKNCCGRETG